MAFKMNPIGKKKCSYSPMQKKGLISPLKKENKEKDDFVSKASADRVTPDTSLEETIKVQDDAAEFYDDMKRLNG
jgi:hypothetical protein